MRAAVLPAVLGLSGCLITNAPPDGEWSSTNTPCAAAGTTPRQLARDRHIEHVALGGDTVLYGSSGAVKQVRAAGGDPEIVAFAYDEGAVEVFDNSLIYVAADERSIRVIIDHGLRAETRWEDIGPDENALPVDLFAIPAGVYWTHDPTRPGYRWTPTDGLMRFDLRASKKIKTDGITFFYTIDGTVLVTKPVTGGVPIAIKSDFVTTPIGIDAAEVYYSRVDVTGTSFHELVALSRSDGRERTLARGNITEGALGGGYLYWPDASIKHVLRRVAVAGGAVETVFTGAAGSTIDRLLADGCNVYWTELGSDHTLYARGH